MRKTGTALAAALALTCVGGTPAYAADGGYFTVTDGVLYDDCYDVAIPYSISLPASIASWSVDITVIEPGGETQTDFDYADGNVGAGIAEVFTCGAEGDLGSYLVSGTISAYDASYDEFVFTMPQQSFTMRAPATRTSLRVSDRSVSFDTAVTFRVKTKGQSVRGYTPVDYTTVRLQYKVGRAGWKSFKRGNKLSTNSAGVWKGKYRINIARDVRVRAVTLGDGIYLPSKSKQIRIDVR